MNGSEANAAKASTVLMAAINKPIQLRGARSPISCQAVALSGGAAIQSPTTAITTPTKANTVVSNPLSTTAKTTIPIPKTTPMMIAATPFETFSMSLNVADGAA